MAIETDQSLWRHLLKASINVEQAFLPARDIQDDHGATSRVLRILRGGDRGHQLGSDDMKS